ADGDRRTDTQHFLYADGDNYRLVVESSTKLHRVNGSFTMYARTDWKWGKGSEGSYRVPYMETVWVDNNFAHGLATAREYDLDTGNVLEVWSPNGHRTFFEYDSRKLFVSL